MIFIIVFLFALGQNTKRETGRKVQTGNINAAKVYFSVKCIGDVKDSLLKVHTGVGGDQIKRG